MDEDFGSSVWTTPATGVGSLSPTDFPSFPPAPSAFSQFDEFDGYGTSTGGTMEQDGDDDFGDFGDFGEADDANNGFADDVDFGGPAQLAGPSLRDWEPLQLDALPPRKILHAQVEEILGPLWDSDDLGQVLTDEDVREVGGLAQVLVTPDSRALYQSLFPTSPPPAQPPTWTRSRIRRQNLISLGVPVNLDEVLPHAGHKPMPALQISTRPMSAPPVSRNGAPSTNGHTSLHNSRTGTPRTGTPVSGVTRKGAVAQLGLGPKPQLNEQRTGELLALTPDQLSLLPLASLEAQLTNLRTETQNTSALLTYLLQIRDALQQDSETYNKLIAELVGEAQKMKTVGGRAPSRRGSGMS
ncbi:hypothetical protein BC834DRAFT_952638 [Gloeopeniophorella convolvens]|nr:hypothetical protein BC834DRAFT_952638 [Gloeopeniophorella convolvens]